MSPTMADKVNVKDIVLERLAYGARYSMPRALAQSLDIEQVADVVTSNFDYSLRAAIYAQRLDEQRVSWPADWWEAFKYRFFPQWALRRWPVREEMRVMRLFAWYPEKLIPNERHQFLVQILDEFVRDPS